MELGEELVGGQLLRPTVTMSTDTHYTDHRNNVMFLGPEDLL